MLAAVYIATITVFVPVLIARFLLRADMGTILRAYVVWAVLLGGTFLLMTGALEQAAGWAIIFSLFWTIVAIPILVLLIRWKARLARVFGSE